MAKEYKTLTFPDTEQGRKRMGAEIDRLSQEGWEVESKEVSSQGWDAGTTCILGCLFLPLALLGRKENIITIIMRRERIQTSSSDTVKVVAEDGRASDKEVV